MNPFLISVPAAVLATGGVAAYAAVYPSAQLFGPTICHTNSARKLAITFDDGPNPAMTPKLLDLLDRYQAKATFFLIGRFVRECAAIVRETAARGHALGNHTDTHPNLFWRSGSKIAAELRLCHEAISQAAGAAPKWFRPPYGFRNPWVISEARRLGCQTVMLTLLPGDWKELSTEWLIRRMQPIADHAKRKLAQDAASTGKKQMPPAQAAEERSPSVGMTGMSDRKPRDEGPFDFARGKRDDIGRVAAVETGDILCLHDGGHRGLNADRTRTLAALEYWLPCWRDLGLEFVTIDEAVSAPAA